MTIRSFAIIKVIAGPRVRSPTGCAEFPIRYILEGLKVGLSRGTHAVFILFFFYIFTHVYYNYIIHPFCVYGVYLCGGSILCVYNNMQLGKTRYRWLSVSLSVYFMTTCGFEARCSLSRIVLKKHCRVVTSKNAILHYVRPPSPPSTEK